MIEITVIGTPGPQGSKSWTVYSLSTPSEGVRYVGVTVNTRKRMSAHVYRAGRGEKTRKDNWIRSLVAPPVMNVLESGTGDGWQEAEIKWIAFYRSAGCDLTNATIGGEGCRGFKHSEQTKTSQSAASAGRTLSDSHKTAISKALTGKTRSPEQRAALRGRKVTAETKKRMSIAQKGHPVTADTLSKMSASRKGKLLSERARKSRPKKLSDAHKSGISESLKKAYAEGRRS